MPTLAQINRLDPTKTTTLRKKFSSDLTGRFRKVSADITKAIVKEDVFGLKSKPLTFNETPGPKAFAFDTDDKKVNAFMSWLKENEDRYILEYGDPDLAASGDWFADVYIESAYKQGLKNAYLSTSLDPELNDKVKGLYATREEFLESAFFQPIHSNSVRMLYTRTFNALKGITDEMDKQISQVLSDGMISGFGPMKIARDINERVSKVGKTRAKMLARTEVIRAHAEAQLNAYESFGIQGVNVMAEWSTAGDAAVCELCAPLEATVMTVREARGLIPRHPNCRCSWIPANVGEKDTKQQKRSKQDKTKAVEESLENEGGAEKSTWLAKEKF